MLQFSCQIDCRQAAGELVIRFTCSSGILRVCVCVCVIVCCAQVVSMARLLRWPRLAPRQRQCKARLLMHLGLPFGHFFEAARRQAPVASWQPPAASC